MGPGTGRSSSTYETSCGLLDEDRLHEASLYRRRMTKAERFNALYTGALTDVLDRHGFLRQTLPPEARAARAGHAAGRACLHGRGPTASDHDYDTSIRTILAMLGEVPAGHVAVYQTNDRGLGAVRRALGHVAPGARLCGRRARRLPRRRVHPREAFPVFCRYTTPQDCVPRWELTGDERPGDDRRRADLARRLGGRRPRRDRRRARGAVDDVLAEAEAKVSTEDEIRTAVRDGTLPLEAYERYGTF